jgi:hypothetical protein
MAAAKIKRENDVLCFFVCIFGRFSATGVRKHGGGVEYVSKMFNGEIFVGGGFFLIFLSFDFFYWVG